MPTFKHPCPHCGQFIARDVVRCPFCGAMDPFVPGRCPKCRTPIDDPRWVACPKCGAELGMSAASGAATPGTTASGNAAAAPGPWGARAEYSGEAAPPAPPPTHTPGAPAPGPWGAAVGQVPLPGGTAVQPAAATTAAGGAPDFPSAPPQPTAAAMAAAKCSGCGSALAPGARFCSVCGTLAG